MKDPRATFSGTREILAGPSDAQLMEAVRAVHCQLRPNWHWGGRDAVAE